jgi:tripartite ATP-independent transporter DctM subunit
MQANMVLKNLRKGIRFVAMTCCGVLILSVFVNVVLRYVFNSGIPFGEDLTRYLMVVVVFFASSLALDSKRHISINLFVRKLSRYNQLRLELLFQICMLAFLVLLMINGSILLPNQWTAYIPTMRQVSMFWFYLSIPVGCILMGIFLTRNLVDTLKELNHERSSSAKASGKNSIWSIGFIAAAFACLAASIISYYSGFSSAVFFVLLSCFAFTVSIGMPVAFSLGITGITFFLISDDLSMLAVPTLIFGGISPFALMAITAFILTGLLVEKSGVVQDLVNFSDSMVGQFPGGLAHTNIVASMFFAGVSGAALADTAAIGSMIIPAMKKNGYDSKFSAVITASSSVVGPIIPPSVGMIIYAYAAPGDVSIGGLFMCGAIPGILLGLAMMVLTHFYAIRRNYPVNKAGFDLKQVFIQGIRAFWGLLIPVIILLGIMGGVFTPTEAGAIAAFYGLFLGLVIKRRLTWKLIKECLLECSIMSAVIFLVLGCAKVITYTLSIYQAPEAITASLQDLTANRYLFLFLVLTALLIIGFVLEGVATMIMLVPVFAPAATAYGIDPHHFGLLVVMIIQLALLTPPVALGLFIACNLAQTTIEEVMSDVWPFLAIIYAMILIIAIFPEFTLWLPKIMGYIN